MKNVKQFRLAKGLSMDNIARAIGVSLSFYEKVERGHAQPSRAFMQKIKKAYPEINIDEMFFSDMGKAVQ